MARIHVNTLVNIVTEEHNTAYVRHDGTCSPQITVPSLRLRFDVTEAKQLADALLEAVEAASKLR